MKKELNNLIQLLRTDKILKFDQCVEENDLVILYCKLDNLITNLDHLKRSDTFKLKQLIDIIGVDYPNKENRFELIYTLLSHEYNQRLAIKIVLNENNIVPSVCNVFSSANWLEREVFDMYGIKFSNHPDLRRILTDYQFEGFPLRKDFPLTGFKEVRYDPEFKKVTYGPVKLQQDYRDFDFESPWRGSEYIVSEQAKNKDLKNE